MLPDVSRAQVFWAAGIWKNPPRDLKLEDFLKKKIRPKKIFYSKSSVNLGGLKIEDFCCDLAFEIKHILKIFWQKCSIYSIYIYNWFRRCSNTNPSSSVFVFQKKMGENLLNRLYDNFGWKFSSINAGNGQHHIRPISSLIQVRGFTQYGNLQKNQQTCKRKSNQPAFLSTRNEKPPPGRPPTSSRRDTWDESRHPKRRLRKKTRSVYTIHIYGYDQICMYT